MGKITCCYKCPDREIGCHSTCQDYIQQKKDYDECRTRERKERDLFGSYQHNTDGTMWTPPANKTRKSKKYRKCKWR